jgi:hypothetical protein
LRGRRRSSKFSSSGGGAEGSPRMNGGGGICYFEWSVSDAVVIQAAWLLTEVGCAKCHQVWSTRTRGLLLGIGVMCSVAADVC